MYKELVTTDEEPAQATFSIKKRKFVLALVTVAVVASGVSLLYASGHHLATSSPLSLAAEQPTLLSEDFSQSQHPAFGWVEVRAGSWNGAADQIISKLKYAGVKRGQIVSIDAHNNGPDADAIFSAHFARDWQSQGDLDITYTAQNTADYGWATFYSRAVAYADVTDIISITSSCNEHGRGVQYVFSYAPHATNAVVSSTVSWVESRAGSWNGAANGVISKLEAAGVQRGQVIWIDAHNNGPDGDAIFSAFYDKSLPGYGPASITYASQNDDYSWATFYNNAASQATVDVISITSSINEHGRAVTYVFTYV